MTSCHSLSYETDEETLAIEFESFLSTSCYSVVNVRLKYKCSLVR